MQIVVASRNIFRRELSVYILTEAGYSVVEAHNMAGLLEYLAAHPPELIVLDTVFDSCSPLEILTRLRSHTRAPLLWIDQGSANQDPPVDTDSVHSDWILWPYHPEDLLKRIVHLIHSDGMNTPLERHLHRRFSSSDE